MVVSMLLIRLIRYIRGYVRFVIWGLSPENLVNLATRAKVLIWGVSPTDEGYEGSVFASDYKKLRPLAKQEKVRIRIKQKVGVPFTVWRYRRRWGLAVGFLLMAVVFLYMSGGVWRINVEGNEAVSTTQILDVLSEAEVTVGVRKSQLDSRELERTLLLSDHRISWVAVNIIGTDINVEIRERIMPPEIIDLDKFPCNIVATHTGQVKSMDVYEGQPVVMEGEGVKAGDLLVSGITEDNHGNAMLRHASAEVIAVVSDSVTVGIPLEREIIVYEDRTVSSTKLNLLGISVPLSLGGEPDGDFTVTESSYSIDFLPFVTVTKLEYRPYTRTTDTLDEFTAKELAMEEAKRQELHLYPDGIVVNRVMDGWLSEGVFYVRSVFEVEIDIAREEVILTEESVLNEGEGL